MSPLSAAAVATAVTAVAALVMLLAAMAFPIGWLRKPLTFRQVLGIGTPFVISVTLAIAAMQAIGRPYEVFDDPRFALTLAIRYGIPIYTNQDHGPQLSAIYGPVAPLVYLPATLATRPDMAMVVAGVIAQAFFFAPIVWLCLWPRALCDSQVGCERRCVDLLLLCLGVFVCTKLDSLRYSGFRIHVDAPALGFAGLSCLMVSSGTRRPPVGARLPAWMVAGALFAALAVCSKQTLAPVVPVLVIHVVIAVGLAAGVRFAAVMAVTLGLIGGTLVWVFGFHEMAFHAFVIPASHPLTAPLPRVIRGLLEVCLPFFWLPLVLWITEIRFTGRSPSLTISRARWRTEPWLLCCLIALCCVPTAALGFAKQGGDVNSWSLPVYFLLLASLSVIRTRVHAEAGPTVASAAVILLLSTTLCLAILAALVQLPLMARGLLAPNQAGVVYDYCRANPGQIYFPWHPAAVLAAEGELHHFYYALFDRDLAGHPVDPEHFSAHVPKHAKLVLVEDVVDERFFDRTFAGYERLPDGFALPVPLKGTIVRRKAVPDGR